MVGRNLKGEMTIMTTTITTTTTTTIIFPFV
jgi:hypothetical protein